MVTASAQSGAGGVGARGFEPVRMYGRKIDRKYRYMYRAAAAAQAFANGQAATWAARTARWLSAA